MNFEVITGFDGSCPYADHGVQREGATKAILFPSLRRMAGQSEETPGAGGRFSTRLRNPSPQTTEAIIVVDWEHPKRMAGVDIGYIRPANTAEWTMIPGFRRGATRIEYHLALAPGITELGLYPEFNYSACSDCVRESARRGAQSAVIGQSREQRNIWMLTIPSPNTEARNFFLQARDHAYETAGSYCVLGILDLLLAPSPSADYLRSKFNFHIVPMTNPDGVHNGMSRLTWEQGADMNRINTVADPAHDALRAAIDRLQPAAHMNIHNWSDKFTDGLLANERSIAERILTHMPADSAHYKRWKVETAEDIIRKNGWENLSPAELREKRRPAWSWKNYCQDKFGALCVNFEFPWFALNTADMRAKGARAFIAFALAAIEERNW